MNKNKVQETEIFHDDSITVTFDERTPCVIILFQGFIKSHSFRRAHEDLLRFVQKNNSSYPALGLLVDSTRSVLTVEESRWLTTKMLPLLSEAGITKIASVGPAGLFIRADRGSTKNQVRNISFKTFSDMHSAKDWLRDFVTVQQKPSVINPPLTGGIDKQPQKADDVTAQQEHEEMKKAMLMRKNSAFIKHLE